MKKIKVAIVEDEMIIVEDLTDILDSYGYEVSGHAKNYHAALDLIRGKQPDIILLDIKIKGEKDGIDLASTINQEFHTPFVFISSHSDAGTVRRAVEVHPYGYLVKPFEDEDVTVAIELAISNFARENSFSNENFVLNNALFVREKNRSVKVPMQSIQYIRADGNYSVIQTENKGYTIRATLKEILPRLDKAIFFRTHKSYIANLSRLTAIESDSIFIDELEVPVGRNQMQELTAHLNRI